MASNGLLIRFSGRRENAGNVFTSPAAARMSSALPSGEVKRKWPLRIREQPHFAASLRTSVFTSQVGKLRDVDDALIL